MNETKDWLLLAFVVISGFIVMTVISGFIQKYLKLDKTEREQVLQGRVDDLTGKTEEYEKEIEKLKGHVSMLLTQYDEMVVKYNRLERIYQDTKQEADTLKDRVNAISLQASANRERPDRVLLVCIGDEELGFSLDLANLRAVRTNTGMEIQQVKDPTPENLKKYLNRMRSHGDHIYLHMAIRSDKDGYQIGKQIVDANWLSGILDGVIVLVVAGTNSDAVGDFLGVVPYVITMAGDVNHNDAALFTRLFWTEIGNGIGPTLALRRAIDRSPATVRESIVSHWDV